MPEDPEPGCANEFLIPCTHLDKHPHQVSANVPRIKVAWGGVWTTTLREAMIVRGDSVCCSSLCVLPQTYGRTYRADVQA
jgi:hypothetical protein